MKKKVSYQVKIGKEWYTCKTAEVHRKGDKLEQAWLSYTLRDGTVGLAQPKNWRALPADLSQQ